MAGKILVPIDIITCPEWDARPPKAQIDVVGKAVRTIFHHTAGHHPEIDTPGSESTEEAKMYARAIQNAHMAPGGLGAPQGGIDSGHNFLVCRNGDILQGRWFTVYWIQHGKMVHSAHCLGGKDGLPDQNDQIGIEHEHAETEPMTKKQRESSARLHAWIAGQYGRTTILPIQPHSKYYNTACPANLKTEIPAIKVLANDILQGYL